MLSSELTPIDFHSRRKAVCQKLKNNLLVLPSPQEAVRNGNVHYPYRQHSDLHYLTGFDEPDTLVLLAPQTEAPFQIFVQPKDKKKELWEGKLSGPDVAKEQTDADLALPSYPHNFFDDAFVSALERADKIYYRLGVNAAMDTRILALLQKGLSRLGRTGRPLWPIHDPAELLAELRLFKSKAEIERMSRAAQISAEAHCNVMRLTKPGMYEYEVEAMLYHSFRSQGATRVGYESIVGAGPNACTLHYRAVSRQIQDNELILVDAGAEYDYYTADITRVFPSGGTFTNEQKEIYAAVLKVQKECIALIKPGRSYRDVHVHAVESLTEELKRLKILKGPSKQLIQKRAYFTYYPHNTSHWLGMDVHDSGIYYEGDYMKPRKFEAGMVLTVEPGLYFAQDAETSPARYKGIGVRIEDDIVVTASGCKVLTSAVPKEIEEIESLCSRS